jgi:hypothetical protein
MFNDPLMPVPFFASPYSKTPSWILRLLEEEIARARLGIIPRSYITFSGDPSFPRTTGLAVGDPFAFNLRYKASGGNPVELIETHSMLYVEANDDSKTQARMIADFKQRMRKAQTPSEPSTMMPEEARLVTAFAATATGEYRQLTNDDLGKLRDGTELPFVIAQVTYRDLGVIHHARRCLWLQPPAEPPGMWHFCEGFTGSD